MLMTLVSLLSGGLGGGLLRLLPEVIGYFNKKSDNDHEYRMVQLQVQLEQQKSADRQAEIAAQAVADQALAQMRMQSDALKDQMQPLSFQLVGIKLIDGFDALVTVFVNALNTLVRPVTTYYFLTLYGLYKFALLEVALKQTDVWNAILQVYTPQDSLILSGILSFWYVGRVFDKKQ